jgi:hypothetical protein
MVVSSLSEFDNDTAFERLVLERTVDLLPIRAHPNKVYDLRTGSVHLSATLTFCNCAEKETALKISLVPLLFGASWKVMDLAFELALFGVPRTPKSKNGRWTIEEKRKHACSGAGVLTPISTNLALWNGFCALYVGTVEIRHSLVHRRAFVDASGCLVGEDASGKQLTPMSSAEQWAFCRGVRRLANVVLAGNMSQREEADVASQLATLAAHGPTISAPIVTRPPGTLIADLPADGTLDAPALMSAARSTWPGTTWVDLELHTEYGVLVGELDGAPQETAKIDPRNPPSWLTLR